MIRKCTFVGSLMVFGMVVLAGSALAAPDKASSDMSRAEQAVVNELSLARTNPPAYVKFLKSYRRGFMADGSVASGRGAIRTKEGVKAVDEAIAYLEDVKPLSAPTGSRLLSLAARDHARDTGPKGVIGHVGTDGSTFNDRIARHGRTQTTAGENIAYGPDKARAIVMQLIVDDGVADRGHRTNIYSPVFKTVGVAIGNHKEYGKMCVMDFADAVTEKDKE